MKQILLGLTILLFQSPLIAEKDDAKQSHNKEDVSANEDLMREHGALNRLLLIYQEFSRRIDNHEAFPHELLAETANLVRKFVENYHERLEEEFVFPVFERAGKEIELVKTLREQHEAGRHLTDYILKHANAQALQEDTEKLLLSDYLKLYVRMFRPHEAREDTVLFPAFKSLLSTDKYNQLGDVFEDRENKLFGKNGFKTIVEKISKIEKDLGIYSLSNFTAH